MQAKPDYPPCTYRVSVKAVIVIEGKVVLVKEAAKDWDLPGGGVEHHEQLQAALRRECLEETGLTLQTIYWHKVQPWICDAGRAERPLLYLVYPATTTQSMKPGIFGECTVGLFSLNDLQTAPLAAHVEEFRQPIIQIVTDLLAMSS